MVRAMIKFLRQEISGLHEAAYLLAFFALLSQLLALVRDRIFAGRFGAGELLDTYYAAFRIPDLILVTAASVVSVSILIPFLVERLGKDATEGKKFIDSIFTVFFLSIVIIAFFSFLAAPILTSILFPGLNAPDVHTRLTLLTRIMLLQPIFLGLSNLFASVTQVYKKFFVYALGPILYNLGIIVGALFFYPTIGLPGLAWGVVVGAFLHFAVQIPVITEHGLFPSFARPDWKSVWSVLKTSFPRTVALSANTVAGIALISLSSLAGAGSIAVFTLAWNLQSVPLSIVGASYSIAAFPALSKLFGSGEKDLFMEQMRSAVRHIVFWSFPALVLFIVLRAQVVRTILGFGEFTWSDTRLTAAALALFALSVVAQSLIVLFVRAYYAGGITRKPLLINVCSSLLIILLGVLFAAAFERYPFWNEFFGILLRVDDISGTKVLMFPLAYSVATIVNALLLWVAFERDFGTLGVHVARTFWQSFAGAIGVGAVSYISLNLFDSVFDLETVIGIFLQGLFAGLIGIVVGIGILYLLGSAELREIWRTLHRKIWRAKVLGPDSTEDASIT